MCSSIDVLSKQTLHFDVELVTSEHRDILLKLSEYTKKIFTASHGSSIPHNLQRGTRYITPNGSDRIPSFHRFKTAKEGMC